ncbi:MAG: tetratricopeptide repeat protein [Dongiaceae bacterium]
MRLQVPRLVARMNARPLFARALTTLATVFGLILFVPALSAAPFDDAVVAFQSGDYPTALVLFTPLAEGGDPLSQHNLGVLYEKGLGVAQNDAMALAWYKRAAEQGNPQSTYNIGMMILDGRGAGPDPVVAAQWVQISADLGFPLAQHTLGHFYLEGTGVEQNAGEAIHWFSKAAEAGVVDAQFNLGYIFETGGGVEADPIVDYAWYRIAATSGDLEAIAAAEQIGAQLPQDLREAADLDVADWLAAHGR